MTAWRPPRTAQEKTARAIRSMSNGTLDGRVASASPVRRTGSANFDSSDGDSVVDLGDTEDVEVDPVPTTDGLAPKVSPYITLEKKMLGFNGFTAFISNQDPLLIDIFMSTTPNVEPIEANRITTISNGGTFSVENLQPRTTYYFVSQARDDDGAAPVGVEVYGEPIAPTDGVPPINAPVVTGAPFAIKSVQLDWPDVVNADPITRYEVASSTSPSVPEDGSAVTKFFTQSQAQYDTSVVMYFKVRAWDADGPGPWSAEVSVVPRVIEVGDIPQEISDAIDQAIEDSNEAITIANGAARVTHSPNDATGTTHADGTNAKEGDIWFKRTSGRYVAQWEFTGGAWAPRSIDNDLLAANINAGKITAGFLDVYNLIKAGAITTALLAVTGANQFPDPEMMNNEWNVPSGPAPANLPGRYGNSTGWQTSTYIGSQHGTSEGARFTSYAWSADGDAYWNLLPTPSEQSAADKSKWLNVDPGTKWRLSTIVHKSCTQYKWYINYVKTDGSTGSVDMFPEMPDTEGSPWVTSNGSAETLRHFQVTIPDDVKRIAPRLIAQGLTGQFIRIVGKKASFYQMESGELLVDGAVKANAIAAEAVEAEKIEAGAVTAEKLETLLVLASTIATAEDGARIEVDQMGIRSYGPDGGIIIDIPTVPDPNGKIQATVNANIWAETMNAQKVIFRGRENFLERGARITLSSSVQDPSSPPSAEPYWPTLGSNYTSTPSQKLFAFGSLVVTDVEDSTTPYRFLALGRRYGGSSDREVASMSANAVAGGTTTAIVAGSTVIPTIPGEYMHSMAVAGGSIFVLTRGTLRKYTMAGVLQNTWTVSVYAGRIGLVLDGAASVLYLWDYDSSTANTSNTMRFRTVNQSTGALTSAVTYPMSLGNGVVLSTPNSVYIGEGGTGQNTTWFVTGTQAYAYVTSTRARDASRDFTLINNAGCLTWLTDQSGSGYFISGSNDQALLGSNFGVYGMGLVGLAGARTLTYKAAYTWFDDVGTTHTTKVSPAATFTMHQRAQLKVTIPPVPLRSDPPSDDDVMTAEIYVGPSTLYRSLRLPTGTTTTILKSGDLRYSSGIVSPSTNTFPTDASSEIVSIGGGFIVRGDGTGTWPLMDEHKDTGWITVSAFSNGWAHYGSASFNNVGYRKIGNRVFLRGMADLGTANATMFTLPAGYRPAVAVITPCVIETRSTGGATAGTAHTHSIGQVGGRLNINSAGVVNTSGANTGWVSFEGVYFFTD